MAVLCVFGCGFLVYQRGKIGGDPASMAGGGSVASRNYQRPLGTGLPWASVYGLPVVKVGSGAREQRSGGAYLSNSLIDDVWVQRDRGLQAGTRNVLHMHSAIFDEVPARINVDAPQTSHRSTTDPL